MEADLQTIEALTDSRREIDRCQGIIETCHDLIKAFPGNAHVAYWAVSQQRPAVRRLEQIEAFLLIMVPRD